MRSARPGPVSGCQFFEPKSIIVKPQTHPIGTRIAQFDDRHQFSMVNSICLNRDIFAETDDNEGMLAKAVFCALSVFAIAAAHALTWTESRGTNSPNAKGQGCLQAGNEFSNASLKGATLDGADLVLTNLTGTNLEGARLIGIKNSNAASTELFCLKRTLKLRLILDYPKQDKFGTSQISRS